MARDPPSSLSSTELRDISFTPTAIRPARITIIHPQLRDLILPLSRGRVLYPRGLNIDEIRWLPNAEDDDEAPKPNDRNGPGNTRTAFKLDFAANCLVSNSNIFACGGQHGELFVSSIPQPNNYIPERFHVAPKIKPFKISTNLPHSRSINNSIIIPPSWPKEWARQSVERKIGYIGRGSRSWEEIERGDNITGKAERGEWVTRRVRPRNDTHTGSENGYDEALALPDVDDEDDDIYDLEKDNLSSSPATYPNTLPIRYVSSHLATNFSQKSETKDKMKRHQYSEEPRLIISNNDRTVKFFALPLQNDNAHHVLPLEELMELNGPPLDFPDTLRFEPSIREIDLGMSEDGRPSLALYDVVATEYATNILGGDQNRLARQILDGYRDRELARGGRGLDRTEQRQLVREDSFGDLLDYSRYGRYRNLGGNSPRRQSPEQQSRGWTRITSRARDDEDDEIEDGLRWPTLDYSQKQTRTLRAICSTQFDVAANHSSLSPDLRYLVSVGDSTDVNLFEVINEGRDLRKIAVYNAATDAGFSSSWSKDGRKFAVASQDGQVTVWDHRSSRPLAIFQTSPTSTHSSPSFMRDISASHSGGNTTYPGSRHSSGSGNWERWESTTRSEMILRDPVTGIPRTGSSTSGKEAARVVKFSPEGSSRDLLVFTEEESNIHIIDARTLTTHVVVPVPHVPNATTSPEVLRRPRKGVEGGTWGISGVAFDPTGDFLYSGTESTVVEWDVRRLGNHGGTWSMR
ncbi:uncharacterized protein IAS62_002133 [Cryptococcus decagattii]|uniref:DUF2415 domain-containing protein n=1 Tax=Cryptococcus decagattii TaxID=1859122 RepID=A0ABZ2AQP8_9TREE